MQPIRDCAQRCDSTDRVESIGNTPAADPRLLGLLEAVNGLYEISVIGDAGPQRFADPECLARYLDRHTRLCELADTSGYAGLYSACTVFQEHIRSLHANDKQPGDRLRAVLEAWPVLILDYLGSSADSALVDALLEQLQSSVWDTPLSAEEAEMIGILLAEEGRSRAELEAGPVQTLSELLDPGVDASVRAAGVAVAEERAVTGADDRESILPAPVRELVSMLVEELPLLEEPLDKLLEASPDEDLQSWENAFEVYGDYLERFGEAAASIGFQGLHRVVELMRENLSLWGAQARPLSTEAQDILTAWRAYASEYLIAPQETPPCHALVDWLQSPAWILPLAQEEAASLLSSLQSPEFPEIDDMEAERRPQQATAEAVEVRLPEDVDPDLLDALLQELPGQTETFSRVIQNLVHGGTLEDVNVAQRLAHTLKGAANTVGVGGIPTLTHHLEDMLVALAKQQLLPTSELARTLMNAADCLEAMGESLCGIGAPPEHAKSVLQEVLDWANRIDREGLPADCTPAPVAAPAAVPVADATPPAPQDATPKTPLKTELIDDLLRLGGETMILGAQVNEQVRQIGQRLQGMQMEFGRLQQLGGELERLIDIRDLSSDQRRRQVDPGFDALEMDQYSELHTTSRMLVEAATDAHQLGAMLAGQLQRLDTMLLVQERLHREIQETVLNARMVPLRTVVPRLQRNVRQTCRLTGKAVVLEVSGVDTLIDSEVLNGLMDPLMHVLRNAVDHGIEDAAKRSRAGKPAQGSIRLDFLRDGNNILVRCRDDGGGLDYAAIRRSAERRGLLQPGQMVSDEGLNNLLLMPNFSTRTEVTQTSGRGVGLDVVSSHIGDLGGTLSLHSEAGQGVTTELRLPLSLISTHALLVRLRDQIVAVADRGIEQILHPADGRRGELGNQSVFWVDDEVYPLKSLDAILQLAPDRRADPRDPMPVVLVNTDSGLRAVAVQEILSGTDLVVKEFGCYVPRVPGILGATILGDGTVTPVLDLPQLLGGVLKPARRTGADRMLETGQETGSPPLAVVADDSLSARRALAQVMQDAGFEVRVARDGMEAVQMIESKRPDIVLTDMEMPRMNGIELTAHLRNRPETAGLPLIMITSRSTAKHRRQAEAAGVNVYLTKPFPDEELLEQVARLQERK